MIAFKTELGASVCSTIPTGSCGFSETEYPNLIMYLWYIYLVTFCSSF